MARKKTVLAVAERPAPLELAEPEPWEQTDAELRSGACELAMQTLDYMDLVERALGEKVWEHFSFTDPQPYFEERVGIGWRTVNRYLAISRAARGLPEEQQETARRALAALGITKAAILAPALREEPGRFDDWVQTAHDVSSDALQEQVSVKLGLKPRGNTTEPPGGRFLRFLLNQVPPEERDFVQRVFLKLMRGSQGGDNDTNAVAAFLIMVKLAAADLGHQGHPVE